MCQLQVANPFTGDCSHRRMAQKEYDTSDIDRDKNKKMSEITGHYAFQSANASHLPCLSRIEKAASYSAEHKSAVGLRSVGSLKPGPHGEIPLTARLANASNMTALKMSTENRPSLS